MENKVYWPKGCWGNAWKPLESFKNIEMTYYEQVRNGCLGKDWKAFETCQTIWKSKKYYAQIVYFPQVYLGRGLENI